jgi:2-isopropylmalate synthase
MAMRVRPDRLGFDTGIVGEELYPTSQLLSEITGVAVQPNKAIIGRNAFAHEAGIHQDGVLKNPLTYEIMTPQSVGVPDSKLVLGKHSGRHALAIRCEQLGYQFDRRALDDVYRRFVRLADKIKHVEDHHLLELIRDTHKPAMSATPLIEPLAAAKAVVAGGAEESEPEPAKAFPAAATTNAFAVPLAIHSDPHHEQQQEDYLWGV